MGLLTLLVLGCGPVTTSTDTGTESVAAGCTDWPLEVGDSPLFGGPSEPVSADAGPDEWEIEIVRSLVVEEGLVQRTSLQGRPFWGDFKTEEGLFLEGFWSDDGAYDVRYDTPLPLYPLPLLGSWSAEASFSNATIAHTPNQGVDTWQAEVVNTLDLELDGIVFRETAMIRVQATRALAVSAGPLEWQETVWVQPCLGVLARVSDGQAMRFLP